MGLLTRDYYYYYFFFFFGGKLQSCHFGGALSDERSGLSCVSLVIEVYSKSSTCNKTALLSSGLKRPF
jgi:hypothetical protein